MWKDGVLFILEAPNWHDTFDEHKGYLTFGSGADPTGQFTGELMDEELGLDPHFFQVTNSVLCLPAANGGRYPVRTAQRGLCALLIREQIQALNPRVVVTVGRAALDAMRLIGGHAYRSMHEAVARPVIWSDRWLFPVYHTGMVARNARRGRTADEQHRDWRRLREFLEEQGVAIPSCGERDARTKKTDQSRSDPAEAARLTPAMPS